jgi:hypothetical protein
MRLFPLLNLTVLILVNGLMRLIRVLQCQHGILLTCSCEKQYHWTKKFTYRTSSVISQDKLRDFTKEQLYFVTETF